MSDYKLRPSTTQMRIERDNKLEKERKKKNTKIYCVYTSDNVKSNKYYLDSYGRLCDVSTGRPVQ